MGIFNKIRALQYNYNHHKNKWLSALSVAFILILPSFIWIVLDKGIWRGDPVGYALGSVSLYQKMITDQALWLRHLFGGYKGPFILWIGQFFVALGSFVGYIDFSLLLVPLIASFVSIVLLFKSFEFLFKSKSIAVCGCLVVASSPLFNGLSTGFWIEPIQVAITSWFIYAVARPNNWNFYTALSQFIVALSLAMLIKVSSPLYIIAPVAVFWYRVFKGNPSMKISRRSFLFLTLSFLFFLPTSIFYLHNLPAILAFAHFASTSSLFGSGASKLDLWMQNISNGIFLERAYFLMLILLIVGIIRTITKKTYRHIGFIFFVSLFQIGLFFIAWIKSSNVDPRYFLPALPYFASLICWGLAVINNKIVTLLSIAVLLVQFITVIGFAYGLVQINPSYGMIRPLIRETERGMKIMNDLMPLAKRDSAIVFDLNPELGVAEFQYELAKQNLKGNWNRSSVDISSFFNYTRQEIDTDKISIDSVWEKLLAYHPDLYITWTSRLSSELAKIEIEKIDTYNAVTVNARWALAAKMKNSEFYKVVVFSSYPELLIYKRCDIPVPGLLKDTP